MNISKLAVSIYMIASILIYGEVVNPDLFNAIDINLGIVTINQNEGMEVTKILLHLVGVLCIALCLINLKLFLSSLKKGFKKHPLLVGEVNRKLQAKTGSTTDRVSEVNIKGFLTPIASTGAWTSIGVGHGDIGVKLSRTNILFCILTTPFSTLWLLKAELLLPLLAALCAWWVSI
ncbi:hypothetical protein [Vibrio fluvialis]|uniref:hypothetical protein n=1 Tax=Vibrio fluvialis TaxID=676 RepID=UPI00192BA7DA|nr:hypothetical protein [Vibrio fluvialis]MBL4307565.1 hypothetical protein [Vibrio fluvialis]MBY7862386.1 hypothetical protein [Vibrio fluvialis]